MKIPYQQPDTQALELSLGSGVLIGASNEGYPVDPVDPFSTPQLFNP